MPRGRHHRYWRRTEDHEHLDRWMVSYADFITLLFAFFVVMYAVSSVNEGKYRVLSESLVSAFRQVGPLPGVVQSTGERTTAPVKVAEAVMPPVDVKQQQTHRMKRLADEILDTMAPLVRQGQISVIETDRGITVEINESILFSRGNALLEPAAEQAIAAVGAVLAGTAFPIVVEGHTDDQPIRTPAFPSNWELSAVRATTVLRVLVAAGVSPTRLTAIGYGDQRPVAGNDTPDGRTRNRRVAIQIEAAVPSAAGGARAVIPAVPNGSIAGR